MSPPTLNNRRLARLATRPGRAGFTIVEMLVVAVIMTVLAGLALAGLSRARHRAKVDKTKSTIRKIHEVIMPHYESYLRRRVPFTSSTNARTNAQNRLVAIRELIRFEMPDSWGDVGTAPAHVQTGPVRAYAAARSSATPANTTNGSAECLFLIASRGNSEPHVMEQFRNDEIGDVDRDRMPEFLDGWNRPIVFIRWAPGASSRLASGTAGLNSPIQVGDPARFHDPFDPVRVDLNAFALVPLIMSAGGDGSLGVVTTGAGGWLTFATSTVPNGTTPPDGRSLASITGTTCSYRAMVGSTLTTITGTTFFAGTGLVVPYTTGTFVVTGTTTIGMRDPTTPATALTDNITNHDFSVR